MKKNLCRVLFCLLLTFTLGTLIVPGGVLAADGHVTVSVEKFTLGRGYLVEPTVVPFEEGDTVADVTVALLGNDNYRNKGTGNSFYLSHIKDSDATSPNIPQYILKAVGKASDLTETDLLATGQANAGWLGEFDYYYMSGWMVCSNNFYINVSAGQYPVHDGDVIRWQFTVYGYGSDLGSTLMTSKPIIATANKDALTAEIGKLNASGEKEEKLKDTTFKRYYNNAVFILKTLTSSQEQVDLALANLKGTSCVEPSLPDPDAVPEAPAVTAVKNAIGALPEGTAVKLSDTEAIAAARSAYDALDSNEKDQINVSRLTAAEAALAALLRAPIDDVIARIEALPVAANVTLADKGAIEAARAAYAALSTNQQKSVTNLAKLTAAEAALAVLENPAPVEKILTVGSGGKVTPSDISELMGSTVVFIVSADPGYEVKEVVMDGVSLGAVTKFICKKLTEDTRISVTFAKTAAPVFKDITDHWASADIEYLAVLGVVNGKSTNLFAPDDLLTRAEFVKMLALTSGEDLDSYATLSIFKDVTAGQWYRPYVNWANQKGIVKGISADIFAPNENISRQDMAVMLYRYADVMGIKLTGGSGETRFADDGSIADYAKTAVYSMKAVGIINGVGQNKFAPDNHATRAEAAAIVHRFLIFAATE